jgi:hypothetical protein
MFLSRIFHVRTLNPCSRIANPESLIANPESRIPRCVASARVRGFRLKAEGGKRRGHSTAPTAFRLTASAKAAGPLGDGRGRGAPRRELFDKNAASHLLVGSAYKSTLSAGEEMSDQDFERAGGNRSVTPMFRPPAA